MAITLENNSTTQSLEAWGIDGAALKLESFAPGILTLTLSGHAYDAPPLFARGSAGILRVDGTVVFRGRFGPTRRMARGSNEGVIIELRDAWHDLERRFYVDAIEPKKLSDPLDDMISAVIGYAVTAGVGIAMGSVANLDQRVTQVEFRDQTCAGMLRQLRRWVPDIGHRFDYTTSPPTIHFIRRADATALDLAVPEVQDDIEVESLEDLQAAGVVLRYIKNNTAGTVKFEDKHPSGISASDENVVVATFDLRGSHRETQILETNNINALSKAWWARFFPWINDAEGGDFTLTDTARLMQNTEGAWVDDTTGSVNEIVDGAVPAWLSEARQVLVKAIARDFSLNGKFYSEYPLQTTINATSLSADTYVRESDDGEKVPTGLAQKYFEAVGTLHYQGRVKSTVAEIAAPLPHCANVLNLTGGEAAARGWTTMRAVIKAVEIDLFNCEQTIAFGPPAHLSINDLQELSRIKGNGREVNRPVFEETRSGGVRRAAAANSAPVPVQTTAEQPWQLRMDGTIVPGTIGGVIPMIGETPISGGSTVPDLTIPSNGYLVAALVFTLTWNGDWLSDPNTLDEVVFDIVSEIPEDTPTIKYVPFASIDGGIPSAPFYTAAALAWSLCGNSPNATTLTLS